jgi:ABC-type glycerol-3-phosphate transport system permease component
MPNCGRPSVLSKFSSVFCRNTSGFVRIVASRLALRSIVAAGAGIYTALDQFTVDYGQMFAMMSVMALFLSLQRQFIRGLTSGAMRG